MWLSYLYNGNAYTSKEPINKVNRFFDTSKKVALYWDDPLLDYHVYGVVQDCSNSSANALELLQSCTKPTMYATSLCD